ncbi:RluA family pseudouridine synthase [Saprospiraceae bacterium]|nr:RluA family pseudouridine synthase [Saprospiraceae bacterium]
MKKIESHKVPKLDKPQRLSDYLPGKFTSVSTKKGIKKAISHKRVEVNGTIARTSKYINGGEDIVLLESKLELRKPKIDLDMEVLYDDDHLAIINKPPGIVVSGNKLRTVENALPNLLSTSNEPDALVRPHPAHRLDFPTSGLLLIGKTSQCVTALNLLFEKREISKVYTAIVIGKMKDLSGIIDTPILKKASKTTYKVLDKAPSEKYGELNLVELYPETGRRHQLRIHMHSIGHPILGDSNYFIKGLQSQGNGLYLHASQLKFEHPINKDQIVDIKAKLPKKFGKIFPAFVEIEPSNRQAEEE